MKKSRISSRYNLVQQGSSYFLLSNTSLTILQTLGVDSGWSYDELSETTGIPVNSLYVFCQRLEEAGLIKRISTLGGKPARVRTYIINTGPALQYTKLQVIH